MLIGLIADTHDNLPKIKEAVQIFNQRDVGIILHAGDYIAPFSLGPLEELRSPYLGVFGNNDGEKDGLSRRSKGAIKNSPRELELDGKRIILLHDLQTLDKAKDKYDLVVYGHTHKVDMHKKDGRLIINPGECGGWLTGESTIAIVDLKRNLAEIIKI
jgi:hypothetical protein